MLQFEVLVLEFLSVDALASSSVSYSSVIVIKNGIDKIIGCEIRERIEMEAIDWEMVDSEEPMV